MDVQCRLCLCEATDKHVSSVTNIRFMVESVFAFKIETGYNLSETVCLQCCSTVEDFYEYSRRVKANQELLIQECPDTSVKFENVFIDDAERWENELQSECDQETDYLDEVIDNEEVFNVEFVNYEYSVTDGNRASSVGKVEDADDNFETTLTANSNGREINTESDTSNGALQDHNAFEGEDNGAKLENRFFRCDLCDRLFSNSSHLKTHQREHRKRKCPICAKKVDLAYLEKHIAQVHKLKPKRNVHTKIPSNIRIPTSIRECDRMIEVFMEIRCELCSAELTQTFSNLQTHYRTEHSTEGYVRCCGEQFFCRTTAVKHVLIHQGTIRCELCDTSFSTKSSLVQHVALQHATIAESSEEQALRCNLCDKLFSNKPQFDYHQRIHEKEECPLCGKTISSHYMKKHMACVHNDANQDGQSSPDPNATTLHANDRTILEFLGMRCELCPAEAEQTFDQFKHLRTHYRTQHAIRGYVRCCGKQFFVRALAVEHIAAHQGTIRCHLCDKPFTARASVLNHIATVHASRKPEDRLYDCDVCDGSFSNKFQLRMHKRRHQDVAKCPLCAKTVRADYIRQHIATQHGSKRREVCYICGKFFTTKAALTVHIKHHVGPDTASKRRERKQCEICKKFVRDKYKLNKHMKDMHSENSNQECELCGKFIRSKNGMEQHLKMHQGLVPYEKLQCPFCKKWLKGKNYLKKHIQCLHVEKGQVFRCDVCQHESPNSQALAAHRQRVHDYAKIGHKLECDYCGKLFKRSINLREHVAKHTGELLYSCEFCGKKFNSNANYYSHRKKLHQKEMEAARADESSGY